MHKVPFLKSTQIKISPTIPHPTPNPLLIFKTSMLSEIILHRLTICMTFSDPPKVYVELHTYVVHTHPKKSFVYEAAQTIRQPSGKFWTTRVRPIRFCVPVVMLNQAESFCPSVAVHWMASTAAPRPAAVAVGEAAPRSSTGSPWCCAWDSLDPSPSQSSVAGCTADASHPRLYQQLLTGLRDIKAKWRF